jgi:hypothetical protein
MRFSRLAPTVLIAIVVAAVVLRPQSRLPLLRSSSSALHVQGDEFDARKAAVQTAAGSTDATPAAAAPAAPAAWAQRQEESGRDVTAVQRALEEKNERIAVLTATQLELVTLIQQLRSAPCACAGQQDGAAQEQPQPQLAQLENSLRTAQPALSEREAVQGSLEERLRAAETLLKERGTEADALAANARAAQALVKEREVERDALAARVRELDARLADVTAASPSRRTAPTPTNPDTALVTESTRTPSSRERGPAAPRVSAGGLPLSSHSCHRMSAWGDVCVYDNVCFDGTHWLFLDDAGVDRVEAATVVTPFKDRVTGTCPPTSAAATVTTITITGTTITTTTITTPTIPQPRPQAPPPRPPLPSSSSSP